MPNDNREKLEGMSPDDLVDDIRGALDDWHADDVQPVLGEILTRLRRLNEAERREAEVRDRAAKAPTLTALLDEIDPLPANLMRNVRVPPARLAACRAELAALLRSPDETEQLRAWKREALEVFDRWEEVYLMVEPKPQHLGQSKSAVVAAEIQRLRSPDTEGPPIREALSAIAIREQADGSPCWCAADPGYDEHETSCGLARAVWLAGEPPEGREPQHDDGHDSQVMRQICRVHPTIRDDRCNHEAPKPLNHLNCDRPKGHGGAHQCEAPGTLETGLVRIPLDDTEARVVGGFDVDGRTCRVTWPVFVRLPSRQE